MGIAHTFSEYRGGVWVWEEFSYTGSTQTWTKPASVNSVFIILVGAGGGGGGCDTYTTGYSKGAGGGGGGQVVSGWYKICLLYTSPSPRDLSTSRMPSSA